MDLQTILDNAVEAERAKRMKNSEQLTLGELVLKLELTDQSLPVVFDDGKYKPTGLNSWRGSYRELALQYEDGGGTCYEQPKADCEIDEFGDHDYKCKCGGSNEHDTALPDNPTVKDLLKVLKLSLGKYYVGYKGGDFTMGKTTPLWVANHGSSSGFKQEEGKYSQAAVDVQQDNEVVRIITKAWDY